MDPSNLTPLLPLEPLVPLSPVPQPIAPVDWTVDWTVDWQAQAARLRTQGAWQEMIAHGQAWSQQQPNCWEAFSALGEAYMQVERWEEAVTAYRRSLELNPDLDWSYHYLSVALFQLRQWQTGLTYCQKLAALNPEFWQHHSHDFQVQQQYGNFLVHQRRWEAAITAYQRALELKPTLWEVWISLSKTLQQINRPSEAIATLQRGLQFNPQTAKLHYHLAEALLTSGETQAAVLHYRRAIELMPQLAGHPQLEAAIPAASMLDLATTDAATTAFNQSPLGLPPLLTVSKRNSAAAPPIPPTAPSIATTPRFRSAPARVNQGSSTLQPIYDKIATALRQRLSQHRFYPTPPLHLIGTSGSYTIPSYRDVGVFYTADIVQQCLLSRKSRILEIGCGSGRIAQVLQQYLDPAACYMGLDVNPAAIQWCNHNLAPQNANFEFHTLPVANNYYYEPDNGQINQYDLSFLGDRQFDCIIALSVFNHLHQEDTVQYLQAISQHLDPYGMAYLTFFTIDEDFFQFRQQTGLHQELSPSAPGLWYASHYQPCFTGYEPAHLWSLFEATELTVLATSPGSWAQKKNARLYPDWFLVTSNNSR
ncbi:MAG: tetratricopeptide repeat protein [Elainella sp. Prado103]|jgi:tetratricopeptide (TPR) repeat protein|nr:tetratricopeptide repeat protein [Elainella sp. Prado103]